MKRSYLLVGLLFAVILIAALGWKFTQKAMPARLPNLTPIPSPIAGGLYADAASDLGKVSRYSLGTNYGPTMAIPFDLLPQYQNSGITFLRFPAGNWGDLNDVSFLQIDRFMNQAEMIHAEVLFTVRLKDGTPERAAELVRYCKEKGYPVKYWNIGNEPNLFAATDPAYDTVRFNKDWRAFALAMKAVDPGILLVGPEISQYTGDPAVDPKDSSGRDWLREFLRANGDMVDVVSVHRYPFPAQVGGNLPTVDQLMADAQTWSGIVRNLRNTIRQELKGDLPIGITEFNSNWTNGAGAETTPDSFLNAIWLADVLGELIRERVDLVNQWSLQSAGPTGGNGLFGAFDVRPSYYVYQIYKQFGGSLIQASSDDPDLPMYAARLEDGALTLVVVNLSDEVKETHLHLLHFLPQGPAEMFLFDEANPALSQSSVSIGDTSDFSFPAYSVTLLKIPGKHQP